jgi:hypothetical protein
MLNPRSGPRDDPDKKKSRVFEPALAARRTLIQAEVDAESRYHVVQVDHGRQVVSDRQIGRVHLRLPGLSAEDEEGRAT